MSSVPMLKNILPAEINSSSQRKWNYLQGLLTEDDFLPALHVIFILELWNGLDWKGLKDGHGQGAFH